MARANFAGDFLSAFSTKIFFALTMKVPLSSISATMPSNTMSASGSRPPVDCAPILIGLPSSPTTCTVIMLIFFDSGGSQQ